MRGLCRGRLGLDDTLMRFPEVVHKDEGSSYGVTVPDLPGCFSGGDTLDEAPTNAQEAITGHIETLFMVAGPLPNTRTLQEHHANEDYRDAQYWGFIDVDLYSIENKAVRLNITLPARVVALVDEAAAKASETRSGFLARAALEHIAAERANELLSEV